LQYVINDAWLSAIITSDCKYGLGFDEYLFVNVIVNKQKVRAEQNSYEINLKIQTQWNTCKIYNNCTFNYAANVIKTILIARLFDSATTSDKPPQTSLETSHPLYEEVNRVVHDHISNADMTASDVATTWTLVASEGDMKVGGGVCSVW